MKDNKLNPRFLEVAKRQRTEGFLEAEIRKVEEFERLKEEEKKKAREEIANKRMQKLESLSLDEKRKKDFRNYGRQQYRGLWDPGCYLSINT